MKDEKYAQNWAFGKAIIAGYTNQIFKLQKNEKKPKNYYFFRYLHCIITLNNISSITVAITGTKNRKTRIIPRTITKVGFIVGKIFMYFSISISPSCMLWDHTKMTSTFQIFWGPFFQKCYGFSKCKKKINGFYRTKLS